MEKIVSVCQNNRNIQMYGDSKSTILGGYTSEPFRGGIRIHVDGQIVLRPSICCKQFCNGIILSVNGKRYPCWRCSTEGLYCGSSWSTYIKDGRKYTCESGHHSMISIEDLLNLKNQIGTQLFNVDCHCGKKLLDLNHDTREEREQYALDREEAREYIKKMLTKTKDTPKVITKDFTLITSDFPSLGS